MLYIASALQPTAIVDSKLIEGFTSPDSQSLLIAKPDRVEIWDVESSGLVQRDSLQVWGKVISLEIVNVKGAKPHVLFLLSPPSARLLLVSFTDSLTVTSSMDLIPPTPSLRRAEFFTSVIAHESTALVSLWVGVLSCIDMEVEKEKGKKKATTIDGKLVFKDNFNINIREHNLLSVAFLPQPLPAGPLLSFLYLTPSQTLQAQTRMLSSHAFTDISSPVDVVSPAGEAVDTETDFSDIPFSCPAARRVLAVGGPNRMALVMGDEYSVLYSITLVAQPTRRRSSVASGPATSPRASAKRSPQNEMVGGGQGKRRKSSTSKGDEKWEMKPVWRVRQGFGTILAATVLRSDERGASVLIGDDCGRSTAIGWEYGEGILESTRVQKLDLGLISPPSSITSLSPNHVFITSSVGDSQLVRLHQTSEAKKGKRRGIEPEVDEVEGRVEVLERWMNIAPVKDFAVVEDESGAVSHLVVASGATTSNSLRIVRSGVGMEETTQIEGVTDVQRMWTLGERILISTLSSTALITLDPIEETPLCAQLASAPTIAAAMMGDLLVTVRETGVEVWSDVVNGNKVATWPASGVVAAGICSGNVVVAKEGEVAVLSIAKDITHLGTIALSAVSVAVNSSVIAIGTWTNQILIYALSDLTSPTTILEQFYASSLIFHTKLLAGLSDGSLVVYDLDGTAVKSRKVSSLGTRPLDLHAIASWDGDEQILAVGLSERMSVIFGSKDRVDFSAVSRKDITATTSIKTPQGQALVLATSTGLVITKINSLKKLSVQTLDMKEKSATKLAYLKGILAVGSVTRSMSDTTGEIFQSGSLELRDPVSLNELASMPLLQREIVTSLQPVLLLGRSYLAVGTAIFSTDADYEDAVLDNEYRVTAKEGRVLIVEPDKEMTVVTLLKTVGPVHDLKVIHGFLAVAAASRISINRLTPGPVGTLVELSAFSSTFIAQHLSVAHRTPAHTEDRLVVGDGMRSVFVLDVDEGSGQIFGDQRDMATHCVLGMESVRDGGSGVVISDGHSNLLTFRFKDDIETAASFGLHEDVVRFRPGSFAPPSSAPDIIAPDLIYATADGRLGMIGELTPSAARTMDDLQRNMARLIKGPGVEWKEWRRGGTELIKRETAGFVDGDFVQTFLESEEQDKLLAGSNVHERVQKVTKGGNERADKGDVARVLEAAAGLH